MTYLERLRLKELPPADEDDATFRSHHFRRPSGE